MLVPDPRVRNRTLIRLAIILALAAGLYFFSRHKFGALDNGEFRKPAPDFSLADLSGRRLSLSEYKGKVVLLNFWATWCDPCRREIPLFVELQNKYGDRGLQVVGVSLDDDAKAVPPFYRQYKMNYPVAVGDAKLAERFGDILGLPVNFLIDRDGRIAARHVGEANIPQVETEIRSLLQTPQAAQGGG